MKNFRGFTKLISFSLIIVFIIVLVQVIGLGHYLYKYIWGLMFYFVGLSCLTSYLTEYGVRKSPNNFQVFYFGGMFLRVILSLVLAFAVVLMGTENVLNFVINFFILYLFFLVFEIYTLLTNLRANSKKSS